MPTPTIRISEAEKKKHPHILFRPTEFWGQLYAMWLKHVTLRDMICSIRLYKDKFHPGSFIVFDVENGYFSADSCDGDHVYEICNGYTHYYKKQRSDLILVWMKPEYHIPSRTCVRTREDVHGGIHDILDDTSIRNNIVTIDTA